MSKVGRARRTPEQRLAAKDTRSTIAYLRRITREAILEQKQELDAPVSSAPAESQ